jgi:hypothetical protein
MVREAVQSGVSRHAAARMQQRGIPPSMIERVLRHGCEQYDHHGAAIVYFDKAARTRLRRSGQARQSELDRLAGVYVVVRDGVVVTVGHRYRRLRRH